MKPVNPQAALASAKHSTTSSVSQAQADTSRTQYLFTKLAVNYGHQWASLMKDQRMARLMIAEWTDGLVSFTDEQIERGLQHLPADYPPSLPAFKALCSGNDASWEHNTAAYREFPPALPKPPADKQKAAEAMDAIRAVLKRRGKGEETLIPEKCTTSAC